MHVRGRTGASKPWLKLSPACHAMPLQLSRCTAFPYIHLCASQAQCVIHDSFLGPAELAAVYAATVLNVHPPT